MSIILFIGCGGNNSNNDSNNTSNPTLSFGVKDTREYLGSYKMDGYSREVSISRDGTKAYILDDKNDLLILDITIDTLCRKENFVNSTIDLTINSSQSLPLGVDVGINRDDIITIGSYDKDLTSEEYEGNTISIPIESIPNQTG